MSDNQQAANSWTAEEATAMDAQASSKAAEARSEGRSYMDRAAEYVADYKTMRSTDHLPAGRTVESFKRDAQNAIGAAWDQPEAAKAMRAAGTTEAGMQRELADGKLSGQIKQGLSAPMVVQTITPQDAVQTRRDAVRQAADAYRANLIAAAPPLPAKPAQSETQKRRSGLRM